MYNYYIECADVILFYLEDIFICYAFFSLLNKRYATRRRMMIDAGLWLLTCALSVSAIIPTFLPYRDIFRLSSECRFGNCTHLHEPGCAVLRALEEGRLALSRYTSYLSMLEDKDEGKYRAAF